MAFESQVPIVCESGELASPMIQVSEDIQEWLTLTLLPSINRSNLCSLIRDFGSPEKVLELDRETLRLTGYLNDRAIDQITNAREIADVERELSLTEEHSISIITINDPSYPVNLRNTSTPPQVLYVKGQMLEEDKYAVSVVGSRRNTPYGKAVCEEITQFLARSGLTIVSGMAIGIDSVAHKGALKMGGRTIAVLGNGLSMCYPPSNRALMKDIEQNGAVISEYPMAMKPFEKNFPERNWLVACMSLGTIIIEAAENSGALITARNALEENRQLYAVPGDVNKSRSKGTNSLIQSGAMLVISGRDVLEDLAPQIEGLLKMANTLSDEKERRRPRTTEIEAQVLEFIKQNPVYIDDLTCEFESQGISHGKMLSILLNLEMKGLVSQLPGKIFTCVS